MFVGDRVFVTVGTLHRGWAVICQRAGNGRWLVRLESGGLIVLPETCLS